MAQQVYHRVPNGDYELISGRLRTSTLRVSVRAEEAATDMVDVELDDVGGTFGDVGGWRGFVIRESEANGIKGLFRGYTEDRDYERADLAEGVEAGRVITVHASDLNTILGWRVLRSEDANRPAETDVDRIKWAMTTPQASLIDDDQWVNEDDPVMLEANDFRGQYLQSVIDDAMEETGKNCFVTWDEVDGDVFFSLFYGKPSSETFTSDARLTNIDDDVDDDPSSPAVEDAPTFVVETAKLTRKPGRVYAGIWLNYRNGHVYVRNGATAAEFADRDVIMSAPNVKTAAGARRRAMRLLNDLASEEDRFEITLSMDVPYVTAIRPGQRFRARFSHLGPEGYADDYQWLRALAISYTQDKDETGLRYYKLTISAVAVAEANPSGAGAFAILYASQGPYDSGDVWWAASGDAPVAGAPITPTSGLVEVWEPGSPPHDGYPIKGFNVLGTGTIDVAIDITGAGVSLSSHAITFAIRKNGAIVASEVSTVEGFKFWAYEATFSLAGLDVVPGDKITASVVAVPPFGVKVPGGTGGAGETFRISGGSLV